MALPYPLSTNRMWSTSFRSRTVRLTDAGRMWKQAATSLVTQQVGSAHLQPIAGPVAVDLVLLPRRKKKGGASRTRIDLDNCIKVCLDSLQGLLYDDDRQIVRLTAAVGSEVADGGLLVRVTPA